LIPEFYESINQGNQPKADELIGMVVHNLFLEPSAQIQDWRVVEIQQKLIFYEVGKATSIADLANSALL